MLMAIISLNYLFKGPISRYIHMGVRLLHMHLKGHNSFHNNQHAIVIFIYEYRLNKKIVSYEISSLKFYKQGLRLFL